MIISKITSGLGNQLFQYALARHLSLKNETSLFFDLSYYKAVYETDTPRHFKLGCFNINYKVLNTSPLIYFSKATKLFPNRTFRPFFTLVKEKHFHFDDEVLNTTSKCITLDGFWQSEKYFSCAANAIRADLRFKENREVQFQYYKKQILNSERPVSIHIRRGDYVNHPEFSKSFGFIGLDYYRHAITFIKNRFPDVELFVFSDDKQWVKQNLKLDDKHTYVENEGDNSDLSDLQLMSLCKHHIIANSSFSWWGAWLNPANDKTVISPKSWYKNKPDWNTKDLVPASWITF